MNKNYKILSFVIITFLSILINADISSGVQDCNLCHTATNAIEAKDTIDVSACVRCHNPNYPPESMGYDTHLVHIGKYSVKADYLTRHPTVSESLNCNKCHIDVGNIGNKCRNCHTKNIPHLIGEENKEKGKNCKGCHGEIDKLFRHPTIKLKIHDLLKGVEKGDTVACTMCHNQDDMKSLKLANGDIVSIQESHRLCYQCHSGYYNIWNKGSHYVNKTIPKVFLLKSKEFNNEEGRVNWENDWKIKNTCTNCHNPHSPDELYQMPVLEGSGGTTNVDNKSYYFITVLVLIICSIIFLIYKKRKSLDIRKLAIPKLSIPKFSMPISIKINKLDKVDKVDDVIKVDKVDDVIKVDKVDEVIKVDKVDEVIKVDKVDEVIKVDKVDEVIKVDKKKKGYFRRHLNDVLFVVGIVMIFSLFYIIFGTFMPMTALISESMSPHLEKGDIVFFSDISKIDKIRTYDEKSVKNFEDYGDVILYKPYGEDGVVPYIHRAMYYIKQGEPMWQGGPPAPYSGYITKGDNVARYDQELSTSNQKPIKEGWIIGIARFRIPYVGYIRLMLPI